ncbi:MAG: hypothetical protein IPJ88_15925 [Myxococcales bacterium]|nr:MAG: hypothetical protein IPJ88_15925 [Myxococcales bacterium]
MGFLRRLEHRIQMHRSHQTHELPKEKQARTALAESLGFSDLDAFEDEYTRHKEKVRKLAQSLIPGQDSSSKSVFQKACNDLAEGHSLQSAAEQLQGSIQQASLDEIKALLKRLSKKADSPLGAVTQEKLPLLGPTLLEEATNSSDAISALHFLVELFERLGGPWLYGQWLLDEEPIRRRLINLFAKSPTLSEALINHPENLETLFSSHRTIDPTIIRDRHRALSENYNSAEQQEDAIANLRKLKREHMLGIGLMYVGGDAELEKTSELLSILADEQIKAATWMAMKSLGKPTTNLALPAVVGLGKLGAGELGFSSDLDIFFIYDSDALSETQKEYAQDSYTKIAQRCLSILSQPHEQGAAYQVDTRLRPSGRHGLLVVSLAAFDRYHEEHAEAWERQSLIRARPISASESLKQALDKRFAHLAYEHQAPEAHKLAHLRARMQKELASETAHKVNPKYGYGGLVDIEFLVQWLQMRHGSDSNVRTPHTLSALRKLSEAGYFPKNQAKMLEHCYSWFRSIEQSLHLMKPYGQLFISRDDPTLSKLAASLRVRARDAMSVEEAFFATYKQNAEFCRSMFEEYLCKVDAAAPWSEQ